MKPIEATGIGILMGLLYGVTLWASVNSLSMASFILYGNIYKLPIATTVSITLIAFGCLFSYKLWEPYAENKLYTFQETFDDGKDDNE